MKKNKSTQTKEPFKPCPESWSSGYDSGYDSGLDFSVQIIGFIIEGLQKTIANIKRNEKK